MRRFPHSSSGCPGARALRRIAIGLFLLLCLSVRYVAAQNTIYSWIDEKGVTHYSNSMAPSQHQQGLESATVSSRVATRVGSAYDAANIPLVILHDDPSQKFVHAVLEGAHTASEKLMLVDTGAQLTVLDEETARELDLEHVQDALLAGVTGTSRGWIGRLPTLRVGEEEVNDLHVMVGPMSGRLLLGMDVLEQLGLSVGLRNLHRTNR